MLISNTRLFKKSIVAAHKFYDIACLLKKLLIYFMVNLKNNSSAGCPVIRSRKSSHATL